MKAKNVEELFGTLQQSIVAEWRKHLQTSKYSGHMALDEFYKEMPEKIDSLIEAYQGHMGEKVENYTNILNAEDYNELEYLEQLHEIVESGREFMNGASELESSLDDCLDMIDSTMYKLRELKEHRKAMKSLSEYLNENLIFETRDITGTFLEIFNGTIKTAAEKRSLGWSHYPWAAIIKDVNKKYKDVPTLTGVGGKKLGCSDVTKFLTALLYEIKFQDFGVSTIDEFISSVLAGGKSGDFMNKFKGEIDKVLKNWGINQNEDFSISFEVNWTEYRDYYSGAKLAKNARWEIEMAWNTGNIVWKIDSSVLSEENKPHLK